MLPETRTSRSPHAAAAVRVTVAKGRLQELTLTIRPRTSSG